MQSQFQNLLNCLNFDISQLKGALDTYPNHLSQLKVSPGCYILEIWSNWYLIVDIFFTQVSRYFNNNETFFKFTHSDSDDTSALKAQTILLIAKTDWAPFCHRRLAKNFFKLSFLRDFMAFLVSVLSQG